MLGARRSRYQDGRSFAVMPEKTLLGLDENHSEPFMEQAFMLRTGSTVILSRSKAVTMHRPKRPADRSKIAMDDADEVTYWRKHFDIPPEQLHRVVEKVGNSAAAVRKE
jgi:hypothetical protein